MYIDITGVMSCSIYEYPMHYDENIALVRLFFFPHWDLKQHCRTYSIHIME
jgi:hypothetical protein